MKKENRGITLIALVITVIILVILAAVAVSAITGNDGLFSKANNAATLYNEKARAEADELNGLLSYLEIGDSETEENVLPAVTDGLKVHLDAYNNTGNGHSISTRTWQDLSGNGNNGQITGAIWTENSLNFDGKDEWVNLGAHNYGNVTLEIVLKTKGTSTSEQYILGNWETGGYGISAYTDNKYKMTAYIDGEYRDTVNPDILELEKIVVLTGTSDGKNTILYQNGIMVAKTETDGTIKNPDLSTIMVIGANPSASGIKNGWFTGEVYSIRIYDRVLNEDEVMQNSIYNNNYYKISEKNNSEIVKSNFYVANGLKLYLDAKNNTGTGYSDTTRTWQDLTGNGYNGTITGATWNEDCLSFNGKDAWVNLGAHNYGNVTLEIVLKTKGTSTEEQYMLGNWQAGGYGISAYTDNKYKMSAYIGSQYREAVNPDVLELDKVVVLTGTSDGKETILYQNGIRIVKAESNGTISSPASSTVMAIGANPKGASVTGGWFNGDVYSVRVYDRVLNESEVEQNYNYVKARYGLE